MKRQLLIIATEPIEIKLACNVLNQSKLNNFDVIFLVADHFTFLYEYNFLREMTHKFHYQFLTWEDIYIRWQKRHKIDRESNMQYLKYWESKYCSNRNLSQLMKTHQGLYAWENSFIYKKTSDNQKSEIFSDLCKYAENLFEEYQIAKVISFSTRSFLSNAVYEIAKFREIEMITLIPNRIGARYQFREDFGIGISDKYKAQILATEIKEDSLNFADQLLVKTHLFLGPSNKAIEELRRRKKHPLNFLKKDMILLCKNIYFRIFKAQKIRKYKSNVLSENLFKLSIWQLRGVVATFLYSLGVHKFSDEKKINSPFFIWFLHARPEESTSVLSLGQDEIERLVEVSGILPSGFILVVKENPIMLGRRSVGFYKKLKKLSNVILLSPVADNNILFSRCTGILGMSGTSLLEVSLIGKPAYAFGLPEFLSVLSNEKYRNVNEFIYGSIANKGSGEERSTALKYVQWAIDRSTSERVFNKINFEYETDNNFYDELSRLIEFNFNLN